MSFEGYSQCLCPKGHYWTADVYEDSESRLCPTCKTKPAWTNTVDDTNCDRWGEILLDHLTLRKPAETATCPTCKHVSTSEPDTYKIPNKKQTEALRHYLSLEHDKMLPISELKKEAAREKRKMHKK